MKGFGSFFVQLVRDVWTQKLRTFLTAFASSGGLLRSASCWPSAKDSTSNRPGVSRGSAIASPSRGPQEPHCPSRVWERVDAFRLDEADIDYLRAQVPSIQSISSEYAQELQVRFGDRTRSVDISGVTPVFGVMRNLIPTEGGRFINPIDLEKRRRVVFVGNEIAEDLFGQDDPVGKTVFIHGSPFQVIAS